MTAYETAGRFAETPDAEPSSYATFLATEILLGEGVALPARTGELSRAEVPRVIPRVSVAEAMHGLLVDLRAAALADPHAFAAAHPELADRVSAWMDEVADDGFGIAQLSTLIDVRALAAVARLEVDLPANYVDSTLAASDRGASGVDPHVVALLQRLDPDDDAPRAALDPTVGATPRGWLGATTPPDVASNLRGLLLLELCGASDSTAANRARSFLNAHLDAATEWTALEAYAAARLDRAGSLAEGPHRAAPDRVRRLDPTTAQEHALGAWAARHFAVGASGEGSSTDNAETGHARATIVDVAGAAIEADHGAAAAEVESFAGAAGYTYERDGDTADLYSTAIGACLSGADAAQRRGLLAAFEDAAHPGHYVLAPQARPSLASAALAATLLFADDCSMALAVFG